jgi:lipid-A-disaccharide synthase
MGFKVFYYIAPKVWAWKESRVKILRTYVDQLFIIFPFEIEYFKKHSIDPIFEGNPSIDAINFKLNKNLTFADFARKNNLSDKPIIALVAGSRKQEIKYNLPCMLKMIEKFPDYQFVIAGAPSLELSVYQHYIKNYPVSIVYGQTYQLFKHSTLALVTSGTATLESALLDIPEVVCYKGGFLSMLIAWIVIKVKYISLVNLIMNREVVTELKQYDLNPSRLYKEASVLLPGGSHRDEMLKDFTKLKEILGGEGASERVGARVVNLLKR